jgi:DNA polymerase III subunit delta'
MKALYPWQHQQWRQLLSQVQQQRLPHALLLTGSPGLGKFTFAERLAQYLLCKAVDAVSAQACGQCTGCRLLLANNHPDLLTVVPEEAGKNIKIDQIREMTVSLQQTAQRAGYQVVIIAPAEALNKAAANALLKTLEEPSGKTVLLLVSHCPRVLPATIISRCQKIHFNAAYEAKPWLLEQLAGLNQSANVDLLLNFAEHAPLRALDLAQNNYLALRDQLLEHLQKLCLGQGSSLAPVSGYLKQDLVLWVDVFISLVLDIVRLQCHVKVQSLTNQDKLAPLQQLAAAYPLPKLWPLLTNLNQARQSLLSSQLHLNEQLLLESLLLSLA